MKIRAICLSDLHFGSETSVLTAIDNTTLGPDLNSVSPVLKLLVECLKLILAAHEGRSGDRKPSLVLAGDVLELALATTNVATTVFAHFINLLFDEAPSGGESLLDPTIVYVPGNHDHHFWETSREHQYARYLNEPDTTIPFKYSPWHATHLFPWRQGFQVRNRNVESFLLNELVKRLARQQDGDSGAGPAGLAKVGDSQDRRKHEPIRVLAMYPNFGILSPKEGCRCAVIHHGHFTESIYHLMTRLRTIVFPKRAHPKQIWDVEAENYAWIDFLWGTLGRSGGVGEDMEMAYNMLRSKEGTSQLIRNLAHSIPKQFERRRWARPLESVAIRLILGLLAKNFGGLERHTTESPVGTDSGTTGIPLSKTSKELLNDYIHLYVRTQLKRECGKEGGQACPKDCDKTNPLDRLNLTFVFGHTHKPFERTLDIPGVAHPVGVYNAGGWVVDTVETSPSQGGAVVVIDEDGHAASIRMYQQSADRSAYRVRVEIADKRGKESNPLCKQLRELIDAKQSPWSYFSTEVAKAVEDRHENMRKVIEESTQ